MSSDAADAGARPRRFVDPEAEALLNALARRAIAERIPLNGSIAMTHRCQLGCVHCYLGDERTAGANGEQETGFWLSLLDQAAEAGCLNLLITGGEPLLRPDFATVYERAIRRGMLVTVFSNGTLVDEHVVALFAQLPPQLVEISLYGASAEVYERVTGRPGSFARCLAGVDALVERGVKVAVKAVLLSENRHDVPRLREMARERGLAFRLDPAIAPRLSGDPAPLDHRIPACEAVAIEMEDENLLEKAAEHYRKKRDLPSDERLFGCLAGVTSFHVDPRGTLLPCLMVSDHSYDLRAGSFRAGWDALRRFHEQDIAPGYECHRCDLRFVCGVCPAQSSLETGSLYRHADYNCRLGEARLTAIAQRPHGRQRR